MDFMNSDKFIWIWYGLWSIGAKPAFLNYNLTGKALAHCVRIAGPSLMLVDHAVQHNVMGEAEQAITSDSFYEKGGRGPVKIVVFDDALHRYINALEPVRQPDDLRSHQARNDTGIIIYTSGTTGLPKAGIIPWLRYNRGASIFASIASVTSSDRYYTAMPLYHTSASLLAAGVSFYSGATLVIDRKFSISTFWSTVHDSKATMIQYVGETCRYLLNAPPTPLDKDHNVRLALGNGLRPDVWNKFKERFAIDTILEFYGATEGVGTLINLSRNQASTGSIGRTGVLIRTVFGGSAAVVDTDPVTEEPRRDPKTGLCIDVGRGPIGELCNKLNEKDIKETYVGYHNNKAASEKKILRNVRVQGDAYFRTGDLVRFDDEGRCFFIDRIGDTFRWKSENVATSEVAEAMGSHPSVAEANVYGVQLPRHDGRAGCAALVLRDGSNAPGADLLASLAAHGAKSLTKFAQPLFLRFTPAFETTGTNKTIKHALREQGVDPAKIAQSDNLYWLRGDTYVPFTDAEFQTLVGGQVRL